MKFALEDIRVIDITAARAGPTCVRQLADWGAEVIRVEVPDPPNVGESIVGRRYGSDFQNLHRDKRSICLNLKRARGLELFYELVKSADVVVENMRPAVKHRLKIDYATLQAINPRVIYGSISGFGQDGPYADLAGLDQIAQGMGGLMSVTGIPGHGPARAGIAIADLTAGMFLALGILAALHERDRSGEGQWVQTSLLEAMIAMLDFQAVRWTVDREVPSQDGNNHPTGTPVGCFATADGYMNVAAPNNRLFARLCEAIDRPELIKDPRFDSFENRFLARSPLLAIISELLAERSTGEWMRVFNAAGVPAGPVYSVDEMFADPQVQHLSMVQDVHHPRLGILPLIRNAVTMSRTPSRLRKPTPELGEHTTEILKQLGLSSKEIRELTTEGVV